MSNMEMSEAGSGGYTRDGSVDLKGNPVLRSKRGGWTACSFVVVYEVFERMAYYGISSNLVIYLTRELRMGTVVASNNVTNWVGVGFLTPLLGAYVADAHLGRYWTFVIASFVYLLGMCLLTLSVSIPPLKPPKCSNPNPSHCQSASSLQLGVYFAALYILAIGAGGTKPNISTIGADQFDEFDPKENLHKLSFFNWWFFSVFLGTLFANTALVYVQDNIGWTLGYGLPTVGLVLALAIFLVGTPLYRHKVMEGSPFVRMARVVVAAVKKWRLALPADTKELHEVVGGKFRIESTPTFRFLNKAAVRTGKTTPWNLSTVSQVEETKQMLAMMPLWCTMIIPSLVNSQTHTLFVKQGTTLNRTLGPHGFQIPPASLATFVTVSMLISVALYDRVFVRVLRRVTKEPRGITTLQRIGTGVVIQITLMVIASVTEAYRLHVARVDGVVESNATLPLTIFVLLPQFVLMGVADAFFIVGKIEFFYDQAPESMKSLGTSLALTNLAMGSFLSSFMLSTVQKVTSSGGRKGWILNNLNASRLDLYYGFLTLLSFLNFLVYIILARRFTYKAEALESSNGFENNKISGVADDVAKNVQD